MLHRICVACLSIPVLWAATASAELRDINVVLEIRSPGVTSLSFQGMANVMVQPDGSFTLPAGLLSGMQSTSLPVTLTPSSTSFPDLFRAATVALTNQSVAIPAAGGMSAMAALGFTGNLQLQTATSQGITLNTMVQVGLGPVGGTGTTTGNTATNLAGSVVVSLMGAPFQTGTFTQTGGFTGTTSFFLVTTQTTNTGVDNRTAMGAGSLVLVAPVSLGDVVTLQGGGPSERSVTPLPFVLTITVPEPGVTMLYGTAIATLIAIGSVRQRRRRRD